MNNETQTQEPGELTADEERALNALLVHNTVEKAAAAAGLSSRTLRRYFKKPHFVEAMREARRDVLRGVSSRLQKATVLAVKTLRETMKDSSAPGPRVTAARCVLEMAFRSAEVEELEERLIQLEERLAERKENR